MSYFSVDEYGKKRNKLKNLYFCQTQNPVCMKQKKNIRYAKLLQVWFLHP